MTHIKEAAFIKQAVEYGVPEHLVGGLQRWVHWGIIPGGFLTAVLGNDLFRAVSYGDPESLAGLKKLVQFLYNECPTGCWGSVAAVSAWKGLLRDEETNKTTS